MQHIVQKMFFRGLYLHAGIGVYNTRPETEYMVDLALAELPSGAVRVADLCAGSGAIGLALATERAGVEVSSVELSPAAFRFLDKNVQGAVLAHGSSVSTHLEDALFALPDQEGTYDLVVSNPPYVGVVDAPTQPEALADPPLALYGGGEDGLVIPRGIVERAYQLLADEGVLVVEHGEQQGPSLVSHALNTGFSQAACVPDLAGRPRFLVAKKTSATSAVNALAAGGLVAFPTDTVFGLAADPTNELAVEKLLSAKGRGNDRPPALLGADMTELLEFAVFSSNAQEECVRKLAQAFWPGPLTLIVDTEAQLGWDTSLVGGTVALRLPAEESLRKLLAQTGPLAVTSANPTGLPPARSGSEAKEYFGDRVEVYVDGVCGQVPSTIVDCTGAVPNVLRHGAIASDQVEQAIGRAVTGGGGRYS